MPPAGGPLDLRAAQLSAQAKSNGLGELSDAMQSLQDGIEQQSQQQTGQAANRLGGLMKKYGQRSRAGRAMRSQLAKLSECKSCMSGMCKSCLMGSGSCQGGQCKGQGIKSGLPQLSMNQSKSSSDSAGTAVDGNLFGAETRLDGSRSREHVTGRLGHGDSETEVEISPDGKQTADRRYRQVYAEYRKLSDAVMTEEEVPLAHRQIIKRYFERIHPDRVDPETQLRDVLDAVKPAASEDSQP
jgi:hypothetical protein